MPEERSIVLDEAYLERMERERRFFPAEMVFSAWQAKAGTKSQIPVLPIERFNIIGTRPAIFNDDMKWRIVWDHGLSVLEMISMNKYEEFLWMIENEQLCPDWMKKRERPCYRILSDFLFCGANWYKQEENIKTMNESFQRADSRTVIFFLITHYLITGRYFSSSWHFGPEETPFFAQNDRQEKTHCVSRFYKNLSIMNWCSKVPNQGFGVIVERKDLC